MNRIVEYVFFFGFMGVVGFIVWQIISPFVSALALSAIIVTICYPLYRRITRRMPKQNETIGALVSTFVVFLIVILPFLFIISSIVNEAVSIYGLVNQGQTGFESSLATIESKAQEYLPGVELNFTEYLSQAAAWLSTKVGAIFAGTASTIFLFFIAMIGSFYLFRDGERFTRVLVAISPLPDDQDDLILQRMANAVRSVATGRVLVALLQGVLSGLGLWALGFERAILWGSIAAFGALIPSVGTGIILVPAVIYLLVIKSYVSAILLTVWGILVVGLIDNIFGPYLMSRGNNMHPFVILLAVLGGIVVFGPIGFIVGPVMVSLFLVLIELYSIHISDMTESPNITEENV